jgi:hypothetical protein
MHKIDVPRCHVANTRWWPPFCAAADWLAAAVLATGILQKPEFTLAMRQASGRPA